MKLRGIIPELKMSEGKYGAIYYLEKMAKYPALSINTSSLFDGSITNLKIARKMYPNKYLIRKDFIMIPHQIEESKEAGADAVLLIKRYLIPKQYVKLATHCTKIGIDFITEGFFCDSVIGSNVLVNSRDLNTGRFNKEKAIEVCKLYKKQLKKVNVIYASGEKDDRMVKKGIADAVLIGTEWMKKWEHT